MSEKNFGSSSTTDSTISFTPKFKATINILSVSIELLTVGILDKWNHTNVIFYNWLVSLRVKF